MADKTLPFWGKAVHPETGEFAPAGKFWARNKMSGKWFLESFDTPYTASPASETYWSS